MSVRGLWLLEHNSELGNAPAHKVLEAVAFESRPDGFLPRSFADYVPYLKTPEDGAEVMAGVRAWRFV
jgi:CRISPR-associated protein Csd2